jgi:glutathione peroxidase
LNNNKDMTFKQSVLKTVYPVLMKAGKWFGVKGGIEKNEHNVKPVKPVYELAATANDGTEICFSGFKGKWVLIVNTASDCGYTEQFTELERLHELYKDSLVVVAFPSNDFKEQEKGSDEDIASFCKLNFNVRFTLTKKSPVVKGKNQHPVYRWLTNKYENGWNNKAPEWNFSKYLINQQGILTHYFGPAVSPLSNDITNNL